MLNKIFYSLLASFLTFGPLAATPDTPTPSTSLLIEKLKTHKLPRKPSQQTQWMKHISNSGPEKFQVEFPGMPLVITDEDENWEDIFFTADGFKGFSLGYPTDPIAWGLDFNLYTQDEIADFIIFDILNDDADADDEQDSDDEEVADEDLEADDSEEEIDDIEDFDDQVSIISIEKTHKGNFVVIECEGVDMFGIYLQVDIIVTNKNIYLMSTMNTSTAEHKRFVKSFKLLNK